MSRPTSENRFTEVFTPEDLAGFHPLERQVATAAGGLEGLVALAHKVISATPDRSARDWSVRVRAAFLATLHVRWSDRPVNIGLALPSALAALALALVEYGAQ